MTRLYDLPDMPDRSTLAKLLGIALVFAALCNGAGTYLKRIGVLDHDAYRSYWALHCAPQELPSEWQREWHCDVFTTPQEVAKQPRAPTDAQRSASAQYIYEVPLAERPLKLAKELFWLLLIGVGVFRLAEDKLRWPLWRESWPVVLLGGYSVAALVVSVPLNGLLIAAAGLRSFLFLVVAVLGRWLASQMAVFAKATGVLLAAQILLVSFELVWGIHLFYEWDVFPLASRVAGTFVQPNSLGVFAVVGLAFCYSFLPNRRAFWPLAGVALALVILSRSGTGLVCVAATLLALAIRRFDRRARVLATVVGVAATAALLVWLLPVLSGRVQVLDSVSGGRLDAFRAAFTERTWVQVIFGSGLGVNTNLALNLGSAGVPTDSLLTGLLLQVGVLGMLLFYGTLAWTALRDPMARPFYAIVGLCTLTMNVTELFPVNALLGVAWAHSLGAQRATSIESSHAR